MNRRALVLTLLVLSACSTQPRDPLYGMVELEPIYRFDAGPAAVVIDVASHGCTARTDFVFHVERANGRALLAFARRRLDTCRDFPLDRATLSFTYEELGLRPGEGLRLANPVRAWTGPPTSPIP